MALLAPDASATILAEAEAALAEKVKALRVKDLKKKLKYIDSLQRLIDSGKAGPPSRDEREKLALRVELVAELAAAEASDTDASTARSPVDEAAAAIAGLSASSNAPAGPSMSTADCEIDGVLDVGSLCAAAASGTAVPPPPPGADIVPTPGVYTLAALQVPPYPNGVEPLKREQYLADDEFAAHFGMNKANFAAQPSWKQMNAKGELGLL